MHARCKEVADGSAVAGDESFESPLIAQDAVQIACLCTAGLAVDALILESGLLGEVLPDFEDRCGYVVEVITGEESALAGWADSASADAVLLGGKMAASVNRRGFADVTALFSTEYILESSAGAEEQDTSGSVPGEGGES